MIPVSPIPPQVAANKSSFSRALHAQGSLSGVHGHIEHVAGEGAVDMMIFPMHVGGNCSTNGNVFGARGHLQKPASRHKNIEQIGQQNPSLAMEHARRRIKGGRLVEFPCGNNRLGKRRIPIAPAIARAIHALVSTPGS